MIPRTDFHCITRGLHALLGEIWQCISLFCGFVLTGLMAPLFNMNFHFDCKIRLCLIFPGRQESFYRQVILNDINEQDTSFLDCKHKHKHVIKCGAPPNN